MARVPTTVPLSTEDERLSIKRFGVAPRTTGVPLLPPDATDEQWLAERRRGVSASELAAVLGVSPHDSPFSLWWKKQEAWPSRRTMAMHIGHKLEQVIGELWEEENPEAWLYRPGARLWGAPAPHDYLTATPDYLVVFEQTPQQVFPLECKSDEGGPGWGDPGSDQVPEHHRLQVWQQCFVFGASRGYLMRLAGKRPTSYVLPFGQEQRDQYLSYADDARSFVSLMDAGITPDIDGHDETTRALIELNPVVDEGEQVVLDAELSSRFLEMGLWLDDLKQRYAQVHNEVRSAMGRAQYAVDHNGVRVADRRVYKRRSYEVPASTVDALHRRKGL